MYFYKIKHVRWQFSESYCAVAQVPLNVLQQELQSHLSVIHNQLVEVINADYDGFVNLTTRMSNLQGAVKRIEAPLAQVQVSWVGRCAERKARGVSPSLCLW